MKTLPVVLAVLALFLTEALGTVYCSNLDNTPTGTFVVARDSWVAQEIVLSGLIVNGVLLTPPSTLDAVQLKMDAASGDPSGFTASVYTRGPDGPGRFLGILSGDSNPRTPGVYTYTAAGITLSAAAGYLLVVTSDSPAAQGAYNWSTAFLPSQTSDGNLGIAYYSDSIDGITWTHHVRQNVGLMAAYATAVPEVSSGLLLLWGALCLACARKYGTNRNPIVEVVIVP